MRQTGFGMMDERIIYFVRGAARQNFGDYLPEILYRELLCYPKVDADLFRLVGSVIADRWVRKDLARVNGHAAGLIAFWGCGARDAAAVSEATRRHCLFFGVRGPLTRDALGLPADTVLGDPGLLAPLFHPPRPHAETAGRTICLPHIHDGRGEQELLAASGADLLVHPEIEASEDALRDILDRIASADFVLTASLHGAIIACAYGRPFAFWDNGHLDVPFKWEDFSRSVGLPPRFARDVTEGRMLYEEMRAHLAPLPLAPLLACCPFTARPDMMLRALARDRPTEGSAFDPAVEALAALEDGRGRESLISRGAIHRRLRDRPVYRMRAWTGTGLRAMKRALIRR